MLVGGECWGKWVEGDTGSEYSINLTEFGVPDRVGIGKNNNNKEETFLKNISS